MRVFLRLKDDARRGKIKDLQRQVSYELIHSQRDPDTGKIIRSCTYIADFVYFDNTSKKVVVIDAKSEATRKDKVYIIKKKLMLYRHKIKITEL